MQEFIFPKTAIKIFNVLLTIGTASLIGALSGIYGFKTVTIISFVAAFVSLGVHNATVGPYRSIKIDTDSIFIKRTIFSRLVHPRDISKIEYEITDYIRPRTSKHHGKERVQGKRILFFMNDKSLIRIPIDSLSGYESCISSIQDFSSKHHISFTEIKIDSFSQAQNRMATLLIRKR